MVRCLRRRYMIPKEVGVDALDKQRPLKLQEVLKKRGLKSFACSLACE